MFACHFNTHKVVKVDLIRQGSSYITKEEDFLSSSSIDFHPTDILEDADGSLILLATGGWLSWGCPFSKIAKPEIKGAISSNSFSKSSKEILLFRIKLEKLIFSLDSSKIFLLFNPTRFSSLLISYGPVFLKKGLNINKFNTKSYFNCLSRFIANYFLSTIVADH